MFWVCGVRSVWYKNFLDGGVGTLASSDGSICGAPPSIPSEGASWTVGLACIPIVSSTFQAFILVLMLSYQSIIYAIRVAIPRYPVDLELVT